MIIVYGQKEKESKMLPVRTRSGEIKEYTEDDLKKAVEEKLTDYPFEGLTLPVVLSKRPVFRG
jgi:threonyl-tRNA synthetase